MGFKTCLFMLLIVGIVTHETLAVRPDLCNLTPEAGSCFAAIPIYVYMANTGKCEEFIYGGCGGNENNFKTKEECENTCVNVDN